MCTVEFTECVFSVIVFSVQTQQACGQMESRTVLAEDPMTTEGYLGKQSDCHHLQTNPYTKTRNFYKCRYDKYILMWTIGLCT